MSFVNEILLVPMFWAIVVSILIIIGNSTVTQKSVIYLYTPLFLLDLRTKQSTKDYGEREYESGDCGIIMLKSAVLYCRFVWR